MGGESSSHVSEAVLDKIRQRLPVILAEGRGWSIALADCSGKAVIWAGEPPLHPDQMAVIISEAYMAINTILRAVRSDEFLVRIGSGSLNLQFHHLDMDLFFCVFYRDVNDEAEVAAALRSLVHDARCAISEEMTIDRRVENLSYIDEKLNQMFKK